MAIDKAQARKDFVKARLEATGKEATPEQRAKFRERFNNLSQTMEGRTKIAQTVLPGGTATERATLKKLLKPSGTGNSTDTTPGLTASEITRQTGNPYGGSAPYVPKNTKTTGTIAGGTVPAGSSATSAVVPGAKKTQDFTNPTLNFLLGGLPGTQSWRDRPGVGVADLPLGVGRLITGLKKAKEGNFLGGLGNVAAGGVELGFSLRSMLKTGRLSTPTAFGSNIKITPSSAVTKLPTVSTPVRTVQQAASSYNPNATPFVSGVTGANRPTSMPVVPNFRGTAQVTAPVAAPTTGTPVTTRRVPTKTTTPPSTIPFTTPASQARLDAVAKTPAEKAAAADLKARNMNIATKAKNDAAAEAARAEAGKPTTATTVPKSTAVTVPKSTTPTTVVAGRSGSNYDGLGTRLPSAPNYKDPVLGDPMPTKPVMPRGLNKADKDLWKNSDAVLDYENALYAWQKLNKKP